jgi:hypothetical protein
MVTMPTVRHVDTHDHGGDKLAKWIPIVVPAFAVLLVFLVYVIMATME